MLEGCWTKKSSADVKWTHLSADDAFLTEVTCLQRLQNYRNFPKLYSIDPTEHLISMQNCGYSCKYFTKHNIQFAIPDAEEQIDAIISALKESSIVYLDMHPSGKNLCISNDVIYLIDFDYAIIDSNIINEHIDSMYTNWINSGGYANFKEIALSVLDTILKS